MKLFSFFISKNDKRRNPIPVLIKINNILRIADISIAFIISYIDINI